MKKQERIFNLLMEAKSLCNNTSCGDCKFNGMTFCDLRLEAEFLEDKGVLLARERFTVQDVVCNFGIFEDGVLKIIVNSSKVAAEVCKQLNYDDARAENFNSKLLYP